MDALPYIAMSIKNEIKNKDELKILVFEIYLSQMLCILVFIMFVLGAWLTYICIICIII